MGLYRFCTAGLTASVSEGPQAELRPDCQWAREWRWYVALLGMGPLTVAWHRQCHHVRWVPRSWADQLLSYPPPPCISYALVQATAGVGTVLIWYRI